jgi:hemerythrin-like domain-containing protein
MSIQIGQKKAADFGDPLGMLSNCHRRIESFLAALLTLAREGKGKELDEGRRASLQSSLHYFRTSGPRHTADEEESLFPRMRACEGAASALRSMQALEADHATADRAHREIDVLGARWLDDGRLNEADAAHMAKLLESLSSLYARHIDIEDSQLFPAAARALPVEDIRSIGAEMAHRRGLAAARSEEN